MKRIPDQSDPNLGENLRDYPLLTQVHQLECLQEMEV
jgi:hypothetical protein